jgi:hypothetical protein
LNPRCGGRLFRLPIFSPCAHLSKSRLHRGQKKTEACSCPASRCLMPNWVICFPAATRTLTVCPDFRQVRVRISSLKWVSQAGCLAAVLGRIHGGEPHRPVQDAAHFPFLATARASSGLPPSSLQPVETWRQRHAIVVVGLGLSRVHPRQSLSQISTPRRHIDMYYSGCVTKGGARSAPHLTAGILSGTFRKTPEDGGSMCGLGVWITCSLAASQRTLPAGKRPDINCIAQQKRETTRTYEMI